MYAGRGDAARRAYPVGIAPTDPRPAMHPPFCPKPPLTELDVLLWADAFRAAHGRYPREADGPVADTTWVALSLALKRGNRGLPGGTTLAGLLRDRRGVRNSKALPRFTVTQVLRWADAHVRRIGVWPKHDSGPIPDSGGETWLAVDTSLREGGRGLPGGSSLARLLDDRRGVTNRLARPRLTTDQVLAWADEHHARTGAWPGRKSGPVGGAAGETWAAVDAALSRGSRGLPPGGSLAQLLAESRGVRNPAALPRLTTRTILAWADEHHARTGDWPTAGSGPVADAAGEVWSAVETALSMGCRGLPGGDSLARLLARRRGRRHPAALPPLTVDRIKGWMRAFRRRVGRWPRADDGPIPDSGGETWAGVDHALARGRRGLPGGLTLFALRGRRPE